MVKLLTNNDRALLPITLLSFSVLLAAIALENLRNGSRTRHILNNVEL